MKTPWYLALGADPIPHLSDASVESLLFVQQHLNQNSESYNIGVASWKCNCTVAWLEFIQLGRGRNASPFTVHALLTSCILYMQNIP